MSHPRTGNLDGDDLDIRRIDRTVEHPVRRGGTVAVGRQDRVDAGVAVGDSNPERERWGDDDRVAAEGVPVGGQIVGGRAVTLAIDLDNVVVEWQSHWADLYNVWFDNITGLWSDLSEWDSCLTQTGFGTLPEFFAWYEEADGWATQPYTRGAQGFLRDLQMGGVPFVFVTARPPAGHDAARQIAARWGTHVHFANNTSKHLVKADVWIDDAPEVIESLTLHGRKVIRWAKPWNKDVVADHVAYSWDDVRSILGMAGHHV